MPGYVLKLILNLLISINNLELKHYLGPSSNLYNIKKI